MSTPSKQAESWTEVISPSTGLLDLRIGELWRYRDLIAMLVQRDFVANYKQTILGPLWFVLQPILTTLTYALIFGRAAGLLPGRVPLVLFYLSGVTVWNYFADCLTKTAAVFRDNAAMFSKVYFPRVVMPVAIVLSNLVKFAVQLSVLLLVWAYHSLRGSIPSPSPFLLLTPALVVLMGLMGLGAGTIISALTTKYRDLIFLISFGVQLLMFSTPVIIPLARIPQHYRWIIHLNPLTGIIEAFRFAFIGEGSWSWSALGYGAAWALGLVLLGALTFNHAEKTFTDTV